MQAHRITFAICLVSSIVLLVSGFLVPPMGIIDGSILTAVGELFAFATLATIPSIARGKDVRMTHGKTSIELTDGDEENKPE